MVVAFAFFAFSVPFVPTWQNRVHKSHILCHGGCSCVAC